MTEWMYSALAASTRIDLPPVEATDNPALKRGEIVLIILGVFLTIAMTIFFIFILRMAHRETARESGASTE